MTQSTAQKPIYKVFMLISGFAFLGSTLFGAIGLFTNPPNQATDATAATQSQDARQQLQKQAQGYEAVLQREPNNQVALQGLADARLQMNDLKGAIGPLEKLVKLNPDRDDFKTLLAQVKQQAGKVEKK
ncbi:MAG: tetratricopeptide repeat protein [Cyanosarcina radialis HA8281-LM2]|jgi:cytochrome c-type biogenesis protein CcmH/NrfG|nr:tetratricopeptide repeat protein [Cyanosarcina radialis HA8281-LM2]